MKKIGLNKYLLVSFIPVFLIGVVLGSAAEAAPAGLTYQGRLVKNNLPVDGANVQLTIKVTSPGVNECVLYEENHTLNMTGSDGIFTVKIGGGTRTVNDKGFGLSQVFSNSGTAISSLICTGGLTSYTSASTDTRNVYVSFYDGVDTVAFSSPYVIQSVPYALEAERLAGKSSTDFLQVTTDTTQSKLNDVMAPTPYTELLALINGTTTQYAKTGSASFTSDVNLNSHKITGVLTPTASTDATNKSYVDGNVGGKAADTATLNALVVGDSGKVLSWSGTQWTATAPTSDSSKLPLAGGTMTGPIAMGSNNITGLGYLTQNAGKYFQIGSYDDAAETTLAGTLLAAHKGATWYNTTTNELKYWSGTQVKSMSTSFANQSANQIMAGPASGGAAAPAFRSLVEADIPQLTLASKVLNSATTATSANTASSIVARDASGDFTAAHISLSNATFKDSGSNTVTLQAPTTVTTSYVLKLPAATVAGDAGKVLSVDGVGQLSWIAAATGSVTSVGVTAPIASTGGASPTLSIAKSDASTNGYLASADFTTFNNKQSTALANANIWVGNGSGVATPVAVSGDATIANTGAFTVTGLRGKTVSVTLPTASGQVLRYDGTSSYVPAFLSLADMRSTVVPGNTIYPATSCTGAQTMTWSSLTDTMACTTIAIADSQITYASQAANKFLASPSGAAGAPTYRTIASVDLPVTGTGGAIVNGGNSFGAASSIGNNDAYDLSLKTNNTARMTILSGGNVGIGTAAPSSLLSNTTVALGDSVGTYTTAPSVTWMVNANASYTAGLYNLNAGATANGLNVATQSQASTTKILNLRAGSTDQMVVLGNGNVGIGTAAPASKLHVGSAPTASANYGLVSLGSGAFDGLTAGFFTGSSNGTVGAINTASGFAGNLVDFQVAGSSKFKVDASGNVTSAGTTTLTGNATTSGNFSQTGSATFSSGTGSVSLNGATTVAANQNLSMASGTGTFTQTFTGTGNASTLTADSVTTAAAHSSTANGLTSGSIMSLTSNSTAAAAGNTGLNIAISGANGTSGITRTGLSSAVTATGSTSTNVGGYFSASGATNNYGLIVANGNVGIGTTSPQVPLHVYSANVASGGGGQLRIESSDSIAQDKGGSIAFAGKYSTAGNVVNFYEIAGRKENSADPNGRGYLQFYSNGSERMRLSSNGWLGLGTTPTSFMHVGGSLSTTFHNGAFSAEAVQISTALSAGVNNDMLIGLDVAPTFSNGAFTGVTNLALRSTGTSYFNGNVGIGTSSPGGKIHIYNSTNGDVSSMVDNPNVGAAATSSFSVGQDQANSPYRGVYLTHFGSGYTDSGLRLHESSMIVGGYGDSNGLTIGTDYPGTGSPLRFVTGGVSSAANTRMFISGAGNVGIGTTAPNEKLEVTGNERIGQAPATLTTVNGAHTSAVTTITVASTTGYPTAGTLLINGEAMTYTGTTATTFTGVTRGVLGTIAVALSNAQTVNNYLSTIQATSTAPRLVVTGSGNVGIGTTTPASKLSVSGSIDITGSIAATTTTGHTMNIGSSSIGSGVTALQLAGTTPFIAIVNRNNSWLGLGTNNSVTTYLNPTKTASLVPISIDSGGNDPLSKLDVNGSVAIGAYAGGGASATAAPSNGLIVSGNVGIGTTGPSYKLDVAGDINTSTCFRIGASVVSGTCTSDERLKENVQDYDAGLSDLLKVKLHTYTFNGLGEMPKTGEVAIGVIAQELEKTNPELVKTRMVKMHPEDTDKTEIKVVDYSKFSYMLINAVKELYHQITAKADKSEVEKLRTETNQLKTENAQLKANDKAKSKEMAEKSKEIFEMKVRLDRLEKALSSK